MKITRREAIRLIVGSPIYVQSLMKAPSEVIPADKSRSHNVRLIKEWNGSICRSRLVNEGREPVGLKEVVLFDIKLDLPRETRLYAEGFQMLSQNGGTLGQPADPGLIHRRETLQDARAG